MARTLEIDSFLDYRYLSSLTSSPDNARTAFVVTTADKESNGYHQNIWLREGGSFRQLTAMNHEGRFIWDDDDTILFPAVRTKKDEQCRDEGGTTFYRISIRGGEGIRAFSLPVMVSDIVKGGPGIYIIKGIADANEPDFYKLDGKERQEMLEKKKNDAAYEIFDEIPYWFNGGGFTNKQRNRLFLYKEDTGKLLPITPPLFETEDFTVAHGNVYYIGEELRTKPAFRHSIYAFNILTAASRLLYHNETLSIRNVAVIKNSLLLMATDGDRYGFSKNPWFYTLDLKTNQFTLLKESDLSIGNSIGSDCRYGRTRLLQADDEKLYFITTVKSAAHLYAIDLDGRISPLIEKEGTLDDFTIAGNGICFTAMYDSKLQEIYQLNEAREISCISHFNDEVLKDIDIPIPEKMEFSLNGVSIDGWILKPVGFQETASYPAILNIHGGPRTAYGEVFYHEMQYWASHGYFVYYCNPEGSSGKGNDFADIREAMGFRDYEACMKMTDEVLLKYPQIDKNRLGVTGGSYGGYMVNWIIGHTDRFACSASQRSIASWMTLHGTSDISSYVVPDLLHASPYDEAGGMKLWHHSPLKYIKNAKTPTLFIHSEQDYRCHLSEGIQMYTALADLGVETRLCCFKGENHDLSRTGKPRHRVRRLLEITDWMDKYIGK